MWHISLIIYYWLVAVCNLAFMCSFTNYMSYLVDLWSDIKFNLVTYCGFSLLTRE